MKNNFKLKQKAVTLLELVISAAILILAAVALLSSFIGCLLLNESNSNLVIALNDAERNLEQIKALAYNDISTYTAQQFNHLTNEDIVFSTSDINSRMKEVTVTVNWNERSNRQRQAVLSTYIGR
jgi:type II secretory pathway pseudopilin PulG